MGSGCWFAGVIRLWGRGKGHALEFLVKSGLPRSPVGSGCAAASISMPQPIQISKNIIEFNDFSYTIVIKMLSTLVYILACVFCHHACQN
jgi:hypothetical protein